MTTMTRPGYQFQLFMRSAGGGINWRMLSGNNRESGRGTESHVDAEACLRAITTMREREPDLTARIRRAETNRWTWQLLLDETPVATAARSADRLIRAASALAAFRTALAGATVRPMVVMSDARRWPGGR